MRKFKYLMVSYIFITLLGCKQSVTTQPSEIEFVKILKMAIDDKDFYNRSDFQRSKINFHEFYISANFDAKSSFIINNQKFYINKKEINMDLYQKIRADLIFNEKSELKLTLKYPSDLTDYIRGEFTFTEVNNEWKIKDKLVATVN